MYRTFQGDGGVTNSVSKGINMSLSDRFKLAEGSIEKQTVTGSKNRYERSSSSTTAQLCGTGCCIDGQL
jgi:hypothetical protein